MNKRLFSFLLLNFLMFSSCTCSWRKSGYSWHTNTYLSFTDLVNDEKDFLKKDESMPNEGKNFLLDSEPFQTVYLFDLDLDSSFSKKYEIAGICYCKAKKHRVLHTQTENCKYLLNRTIHAYFENVDCKVEMTYKKRKSDIDDNTFKNLEWKKDNEQDLNPNSSSKYEIYSLYNVKKEPLVDLEFNIGKNAETYRGLFFNKIIGIMESKSIINFD